jgi:hypothetical protein
MTDVETSCAGSFEEPRPGADHKTVDLEFLQSAFDNEVFEGLVLVDSAEELVRGR